MRICTTVLIGLALAPRAAFADTFEVSDLDASDVVTIKPYFAFETNRDETGVDGPGLDLTLPVALDLEASVTAGAGSIRSAGRHRRWGTTDATFAMKWAIAPVPDAGGWGVAIEPAIVAPTGSHGIGGGEWRAELPVMVAWVDGPWELRGKLGYGRGFKGAGDEIFVGALVKYTVSEILSVGAEIVGEAENFGLLGYQPAVNFGVNWLFLPGIEVQARVGRSLHAADRPPTTTGKMAVEFAL